MMMISPIQTGLNTQFFVNRASDEPKLKGQKERNPVSLRVKDAAEGLLTCIMDHVGSFPPPCGPESVCSLLDEETLLKYGRESGLPEATTPFRYFVLDSSTIVGLLEQPLGNDEDPLPTVTALIRGPFGRHAWTMQLRDVPRHQKSASKAHLVEPKRPEPNNNVGIEHNVKQRYFPPIVDSIPTVEVDKSIPSLESTMSEHADDLLKLDAFIKEQVIFEKKIEDRVKNEINEAQYPSPDTECKPPQLCHDFQTARLFLSHYGFLSLEALKEPQGCSVPASLVLLDTQDAATFQNDLQQLDSIPCRTADTVHVFYVKSTQKMPFEILSNVTKADNVSKTYLEFLRSLGWPVDVKKHAGWTGHSSTSWRIMSTDESDEFYPGDTGGSLYDGRKQVLYWADVTCEVAFVVPSPDTYQPTGRRSSLDSAADETVQLAENPEKGVLSVVGATDAPKAQRPSDIGGLKPKSLSLDLENNPVIEKRPRSITAESPMTPTEAVRMRRSGRLSTPANISEIKIFVVWLENYEDYETFPAGDLLQSTCTGLETAATRQGESSVYIIYIHSLNNGLFRIHLQGQPGRTSLAIPLVDGMVVSRRTLGSLVRQTAINICRRRRLENEIYQPPHIRRKLKIKEILDKYKNKLTEPEFYTALFQDV